MGYVVAVEVKPAGVDGRPVRRRGQEIWWLRTAFVDWAFFFKLCHCGVVYAKQTCCTVPPEPGCVAIKYLYSQTVYVKYISMLPATLPQIISVPSLGVSSREAFRKEPYHNALVHYATSARPKCYTECNKGDM